MICRKLKEYENGKISAWEFIDIDSQKLVYYVKRILLDDGRFVIWFGKNDGDGFFIIYHSNLLAFNAFMEINNMLTSWLIHRRELQQVLSFTSGDMKVSTISKTFVRSFLECAELMQEDPFSIIITGGETKSGRSYVNCELDCD